MIYDGAQADAQIPRRLCAIQTIREPYRVPLSVAGNKVQRGQLLRLMASSSMRAAVQHHFGLRFEFQNCHNVAAFRLDAIGSPEHRRFVLPEAQIRAQSPELVDC